MRAALFSTALVGAVGAVAKTYWGVLMASNAVLPSQKAPYCSVRWIPSFGSYGKGQ